MYKKRLFVFIALLNVAFITWSQNDVRQKYILKYQVLAIKEMSRSGVPASITMAQACLESGDGKSELASLSNNHFGIKCKSNWTGKKVYYDDDERNECFRSYNSVEASYKDHTDFLMQNFRYSTLFELKHTDYKSWAKGLKKAGYATDPHYDKRLITIIEEFELYNLDRKWSTQELTNFETVSLNNNKTGGLVINPYQTRNVEIRNRLKTVVVRKGDSFETIAQEFGLENWELYRFNDYPRGFQPQANEILYIQAKKRKAAKGTPNHTLIQDESMHFISQLYGIKLRPLYKRNKMKFGEVPQLGQVIYLRKKRNK
ncbi:MAG: glucosaminidase domain-containing protein [Mariniphaga sp.]|nr:glucosaminidase domain-containing protein [Mariniphaga sp.]